MSDELVLVTGGTGFIAQHCILALSRRGYRVRTTVRSLTREQEVRKQLEVGGAATDARLSFVSADLTDDSGWKDAMEGCVYVLHGASPTPSGDQVSEDDWIRPAVDGNLRVLHAARDAGVRRVVLNSAFGAIGVGHPADYRRPFDEADWSELTGDVAPYQKSKTLSERAAWDFIQREGGSLELSTVNPVAVLGPVLGADFAHSIRLIKNMLDGQPGCLNINSGRLTPRFPPSSLVQRLHACVVVHSWAADKGRHRTTLNESMHSLNPGAAAYRWVSSSGWSVSANGRCRADRSKSAKAE
jgi:dihydroflavonol-4-reductase